MRNLSYEQRLRKMNLPTLTYRRHRADMIELYKICYNIYDSEINMKLKFSKDATERDMRGHRFKLSKERCKTTLRQQAFPHRAVNHWNSLPANIVEAPSLNAFKARLDKHWEGQEVKYNFKAGLRH